VPITEKFIKFITEMAMLLATCGRTAAPNRPGLSRGVGRNEAAESAAAHGGTSANTTRLVWIAWHDG